MSQSIGVASGPAVAGFNAQSARLHALQQRKELLTDEYNNAMQQRGRIGQERLNAQARGDVAMVREYEGSVTRIGQRMQELERTIQGVDQQIDEAMKTEVPLEELAPIAAGSPTSITVMPSFPSEAFTEQRMEFQRMMVAEGVVFVLLAALLWRFGVARGRRQAVQMDAPRTDVKLQQAVDAIALEVERLSEGQRFVTNILSAKRPEHDALPVPPRPVAEARDGSWNTPH
ncbi:MAG: hypothetical protein ABMA00_17470 [Gemmatimonas sp.]